MKLERSQLDGLGQRGAFPEKCLFTVMGVDNSWVIWNYES